MNRSHSNPSHDRLPEARAGRPFRIAQVTDPHISKREEEGSYRQNFQRVIEQVNAEGVDAVLMVGDLTSDGLPDEVDDYRASVARFGVPVRTVPGNHDVGCRGFPGQEASVTQRRVAQFEELVGPSFFAEPLSRDIRLVGINASLLDSGLETEGAQWAFLEKELAAPGDQTTILLTHYPLFVDTVDEPSGYFNIAPASRQRLLELIERAKVKLVLSGHLHRPVQHRYQDVLHLTAPPVSFGLPRGDQPEGWMLVTVEPDGKASGELRYLDRDGCNATT